MNALRRPRRGGNAISALRRAESGFTLIEVSVAAILVVTFAVGIASTFGAAFGVERGNILRQQATSVVNQEIEYARSLNWSQLAMASIDPDAPMLGSTASSLLGSEVGFSGEETLVVLADTGFVTPYRSHTIDGATYDAWRYVTHSTAGSRRFVVLVTWSDEGSTESLIAATQISQVSARANDGAVMTLADGSGAPTTMTSSTTSTSTTSTTSTTTSSTTTTTTLPGLVIEKIDLSFNVGSNTQTAEVYVDYATGGNASGVVVHGEWSTTPLEVGYPFVTYQTTSGPGKATFTHVDGHPNGTVVQFCVTDLVLPGYSYTGGTQCVSKAWG